MLLYRIFAAIAFALYGLRLRLGAASPAAASERRGRGPTPAAAPRLWLHGASNGELTSARGVVETLLARAPDLSIIVTANSATGGTLVRSWGRGRIDTAFAPFDTRGAVAAFLDRWQPKALVIVENELWPERFVSCAERGIPVFVIGARMSRRSARHWGRLPGLRARIFSAIRFLSAQDAASEARFRDLGLPGDRLGPIVNLKSAVTTRGAAEPLPFPRDTTLLAASTHEGEEEQVLAAFRQARDARPDLRLLLAPRHPRRRDEIEAAIRKTGLSFATRSRGDAVTAGTDIYLADTMGEMDLWYGAAGMTFVGGSLVDRGGHTPFEPAAHASAILHGPHVANSATAYRALAQAGAAIEVTTPDALAEAIVALADVDRQADMTVRAHTALAELSGGDGLDVFYAALADATGLPLQNA
ncbi:3-deoxy-D-manno-octulosonic acid transferase [Defluviimonas aquaemixtae]|uniref:3-deoxy-D-manno-octulosonic acid transferase n=1 Tax=Albidovulum aquaemixtae TaxID=1542388 RepID=A0A2R8B343_9RHOB|nr:glycosyltransferase N-terminal domain-containing protein [Defluviimonas aquaemixtae]SPH16995.1 3-deoxy-D-manno-octulosonic acid transferase [Defluviimonas aquaemixtae]